LSSSWLVDNRLYYFLAWTTTYFSSASRGSVSLTSHALLRGCLAWMLMNPVHPLSRMVFTHSHSRYCRVPKWLCDIFWLTGQLLRPSTSHSQLLVISRSGIESSETSLLSKSTVSPYSRSRAHSYRYWHQELSSEFWSESRNCLGVKLR
jgi:hypothetical protein